MRTKLNLRALALAGLLAGVAGLSWYLQRPAPEAPAAGIAAYGSLGYYLDDVVFYGTDADGNVLYELTAGRAEERPDERRLALEGVRLEYRPVAAIDWHFSASSGEASLDDGLFRLAGGVELVSPPAPAGNDTVIRTATLSFDAAASLAIAEDEASVVIGTEVLEAIGLRAFLRENRLELDSNVHAQFRR
jgi:LPS export ABC transporter protein LptC